MRRSLLFEACNFIKKETSVFLRILQNFLEHLFCRTSANGSFWDLRGRIFLGKLARWESQESELMNLQNLKFSAFILNFPQIFFRSFYFTILFTYWGEKKQLVAKYLNIKSATYLFLF